MKDGDAYTGWLVGEEKKLLTTAIGTIKTGPATCHRTGKQKDFYFFDFPPWVNVVALTHDNLIVLIRQFRYGSRKMEIEIPGGMVDQGEAPLEAGCRELLEETGYVGSNARIIGRVCPNPAIQRNYCYTVLVENAVRKQEVKLDEMEDIESFLAPVDEVFRFIEDGTIDHGLVLNGLMFYRMLSCR